MERRPLARRQLLLHYIPFFGKPGFSISQPSHPAQTNVYKQSDFGKLAGYRAHTRSVDADSFQLIDICKQTDIQISGFDTVFLRGNVQGDVGTIVQGYLQKGYNWATAEMMAREFFRYES